MPKEIERKFLVASDAWRMDAGPGITFRQAVIFSEENRILRVRLIGGETARLTIKIGIDAQSRHEFEYDIPRDHAEELLGMALGTVLEKTRYEVGHGDHVWEIDCYSGALDGLVIAEVEMDAADDNPLLPAWLGREVTEDRRFSNQALAEGSLGSDWRANVLSA